MQKVQPDEIYNLGAQSHVAVSFEQPEYTANVDGLGTLRLLEAIRILGMGRDALLPGLDLRTLRTGAGDAAEREDPVLSALPYAVAKLYAYWITVNYREAYGMYACNGILFNHESPSAARRSSPARSPALWHASRSGCRMLYLGNLDAHETGAMPGITWRCSG